jgi:hypothetical protein
MREDQRGIRPEVKDRRSARGAGQLSEKRHERAVFVGVLIDQDRYGSVATQGAYDAAYSLSPLNNLDSTGLPMPVEEFFHAFVSLSGYDKTYRNASFCGHGTH